MTMHQQVKCRIANIERCITNSDNPGLAQFHLITYLYSDIDIKPLKISCKTRGNFTCGAYYSELLKDYFLEIPWKIRLCFGVISGYYLSLQLLENARGFSYTKNHSGARFLSTEKLNNSIPYQIHSKTFTGPKGSPFDK